MSTICWVSLDPVNPAIAPYPPPFNRKLEDAYHRCEPGDPVTERCALGADFFNSTIFFRKAGEDMGKHYQTTPAVSYGPRGGTKPAGYREVRRIELQGGDTRLTLRASTHNLRPEGEWRIVDADPCMRELSMDIAERFLLKTEAGADQAPAAMLVPVWQWCLDTEEAGPVFNKPDDRWATYLAETSNDIERAYQANQARFDLELGVRQVTIVFNEDNRIYGLQKDEQFNKQRHVRRKMVAEAERDRLLHPSTETSGEDAMCAVCMSEFRATATWPVVKLPCKHVFHSCCVQVLRDRNEARCPMCRGFVDWSSISEGAWEPLTPS